MPANFDCPTQTVIPGQLITSALWNGEFTNIFNNFVPAGMDDYSLTDGQMQTATNPFPGSVISRPTSLAGELERLRFALSGITGLTYWYQPPTKTMEQLNTFSLGHTHTGSTDGAQIPTGGIADGAVTMAKLAGAIRASNTISADTNSLIVRYNSGSLAENSVTGALEVKDASISTAKLAASAVTDAKVSDVATTKLTGTIATAQIADAAVTNAKINDVATSKLTGTISTSQIGDAQVSYAKLASDVTSKLSPKSIQRSSGNCVFSGDAANTDKTTNVTISSVDTTKAYVLLNGYTGAVSNGAGASPMSVKAQLTSATNVELKATCSGSSNNNGTITVYFTVVEWN